MPHDLLVKLYGLSPTIPTLDKLHSSGIDIRRALPIDKHLVVGFVRDIHSDLWASECDCSFSRQPPTCFIAVKDRDIVGFACYNATCWGFFGPTAVSEGLRGQGIGAALTLRCLLAMWEEGYAYAVIGWVDDTELGFYQKVAGATVIEGSFPGIYRRMVKE